MVLQMTWKSTEEFGVSKEDCLRGFIPLRMVYYACLRWYGVCDRDNLCLTENRIMRGEWGDDCKSKEVFR